MQLSEIHHYDTYVPILSELKTRHTWNQAVKLVIAALEPLGSEYCGVLERGLNGRWCDRYPNQGKQSGAFSSRLVRRRSVHPDELSARRARPRLHAGPRGGPLDAQLLLGQASAVSVLQLHDLRGRGGQHVQRTVAVAAPDEHGPRATSERAFLINREIDAIRGTILRQTMFAEFERITHELAEAGEPLTVDRFKSEYRKLLELYFGPDFTLDDELSLECFRIPHFYRAFYVYKYATGLSAAIALAERVTGGGAAGTGRLPGLPQGRLLESTRSTCCATRASTWNSPQPVDTALGYFERLVDELDELLDRPRLESVAHVTMCLHRPTAAAGALAMQLGLVTYQWGADWDLPTLIKNCEKTGFRGVELRTTHKHGVEPSLDEAAAQGSRQAICR